MKNLTVRVEDDELNWVRHAAGLRDLSISEYVRRAINASLRREGVDAVLLAVKGRRPRRVEQPAPVDWGMR